jgi:hypothetical protein
LRHLLGEFILSDLEVVAGLQIHPERRSIPEISGKTEGSVGGNAAPLVVGAFK